MAAWAKAAVLVLSGCGRQQLPEETPADMGLAAVAAIESHAPPALELTKAQTPPEEPVEEPEEPEEPGEGGDTGGNEGEETPQV